MAIMYCKHPSSLLACIIIFAKRGETGILERVLPSAVTMAIAPSKVRPREIEATEAKYYVIEKTEKPSMSTQKLQSLKNQLRNKAFFGSSLNFYK